MKTVTAERELDSRYDPSEIEGPLYEEWIRRGYFHAAAEDASRPYVIVIPPPNVTGALHMGHGLNNALQDVLIRWRRMQGYDALWVPGTDHAGIATQNVVERALAEEGRTRWDLGRDRFEERVWEWVDRYGNRILDQLRALGCSCDWERTRFTLDEGLSRAVRQVFVRLYEKGLVYRGRYVINWCPRCATALANDEVEHEETKGNLWRIRYPLAGEAGGFLEVATTRPETMLGDTGLAVHPDDPRYTDLVGKEAVLPLAGRRLPVVADSHVDPEFGTGIVKVTPAHDPNDFEIGVRHDLPAVDIMNDDGTIGDGAPAAYRGLDRFDARRRVVEDLQKEGLLAGIEDHHHAVGHCYRCETVVEPRLSLQWFVRMRPLAEPALAAYRQGRLRFFPERYGKVYADWMENIRDWCISRQIWWGHRIPVWYCREDACEEIVVAMEDPHLCPSCGGELDQDPDVLDTWFSSWLWPFSTLGWPDDTADLRIFYPTSTLVTAEEILFFWVARMAMAGLEFMEEAPFSDVVINGTVRDHLGRRMSKSLGNGIDPLEVVERYGADALRFTLVRASPPGTDLQLNYQDLDASFRPGTHFANKIWNAARFALPYLREVDLAPPEAMRLELADRWILSRFRSTARAVTEALEAYRFHEAAEAIHGFIWREFCDWYLELVKERLGGGRDGTSRDAAAATLATVLLGWLRLLHPIMPFITEAIARRLPGWKEDSLMTGPWPEPPDVWEDPEAEATMEELRAFVGAVRNLRSEYGVDAGRSVDVELRAGSAILQAALEEEREGIFRLGGISEVRISKGAEGGTAGAHAVLRSGAELFVPLADVIDVDRERGRLAAEVERLQELAARSSSRLENRQFLEKAPPEVVEREREKARSLAEQKDRLRTKLRALGGDR